MFRNISLLCLIGALLALPAQAQTRAVPQSKAQMQLSFAPVVKQAAPAVVNIYTKRKVVEQAVSPFFNDPFFNQFFGGRMMVPGRQRERVVSSLGSGVIIDSDGLLVTSHHVVKDAEDIMVVLSDRREFDAEMIRTDEQSDLALLRIETEGEILPSIAFQDSDKLEVGDLVLAIGNPFGVGQTVTSGIVSALARPAAGVNDYQFFIQTDAAINPGNSGGALVNMDGKLVGINTAIYTRSGGSNGIGFAIPSNLVQALTASVTRDGKVVKPWLGASYQNVTAEIAESLNMPTPHGVLVSEVFAESPAKLGGLKAGDVILKVDDQPVDSIQALRFRTALVAPNTEATFTLLRNHREVELTIRLTLPPENPPRDVRTLNGKHPLNGVTVANLNPALAIELGLDPDKRGVVVLSGRGGLAKLEPGDRVLQVNQKPIQTTVELEQLLRTARGWNIQFQRDGQLFNLRVTR